MPICQLCGLETKVTKHHLIPQTMHRRERNRNHRKYTNEELNTTIPVCQPCHGRIHSKYDDKDLLNSIHTLEILRGTMQDWIKWRRNHPNIEFTPSKLER